MRRKIEVTVEDKVNYWKDWIGIGSEWLTVEFEPVAVMVTDIVYCSDTDSIKVEYISEDNPHSINFSSVAQFVDGRFIRNYRD